MQVGHQMIIKIIFISALQVDKMESVIMAQEEKREIKEGAQEEEEKEGNVNSILKKKNLFKISFLFCTASSKYMEKDDLIVINADSEIAVNQTDVDFNEASSGAGGFHGRKSGKNGQVVIYVGEQKHVFTEDGTFSLN